MKRDDPLIVALREFARLHGVTPEGFRDLEPRLSDWAKFLRAQAVSEVPDMRRATKWSEVEYQNHNLIRALLAQWSQSVHKRLKLPREHRRMLAQLAHQYRDITGIRTIDAEKAIRPDH